MGYALRRCASPEDAADVVAETFAVAWRRIDELPDGDVCRPWLYGTARRVLLRHFRNEKRHRDRHTKLQGELTRLYQNTPVPESAMSEIGRVFRELTEDEREILTLLAWEGLTQAEIATVLDCSRNAVRIRLHRARKRFSKLLAAAGIDTPLSLVERTS